MRRVGRVVHIGVVYVFLSCVVLQPFLIGLWLFGAVATSDLHTGAGVPPPHPRVSPAAHRGARRVAAETPDAADAGRDRRHVRAGVAPQLPNGPAGDRRAASGELPPPGHHAVDARNVGSTPDPGRRRRLELSPCGPGHLSRRRTRRTAHRVPIGLSHPSPIDDGEIGCPGDVRGASRRVAFHPSRAAPPRTARPLPRSSPRVSLPPDGRTSRGSKRARRSGRGRRRDGAGASRSPRAAAAAGGRARPRDGAAHRATRAGARGGARDPAGAGPHPSRSATSRAS